ncbi:MAG: MmcQ/YjbR family DNA-binding protein [Candidatus Corynebacterium faecigallinarum]
MPAFYVAGKTFLRFHEEPGVLVCWCKDPSERELLLATGEASSLRPRTMRAMPASLSGWNASRPTNLPSS